MQKKIQTQFFLFLRMSILSVFLIQSPNAISQETKKDRTGPNGFSYEVKGGEVSAVMRSIARRASEMNFDAQRGFTGFTVKGALFYGHELEGFESYKLGSLDRRSGPMILPYEYSKAFSADGQQRALVTAFGFRNMNVYSNVKGTHFNVDGFFSIINTLDFITLNYDQNYAYNNLKTLDLKWITIEPRIRVLYSNEKKYYLNLRGSGDLGMGKGWFVQPDGSKKSMGGWGQDRPPDQAVSPLKSSYGFRSNYSVGLEFNKKMKGGGELNLQTNWKQGYHQITLFDSDQMLINRAAEKQAEIEQASYAATLSSQTQTATFKDKKYWFYRNKLGGYISEYDVENQHSDEDYIRDSGPISMVRYPSTIVSAPRTYQLIHTSLAYSRVMNQKRLDAHYNTSPDLKSERSPIRLGFEIEWTLLVKDEFKNVRDGVDYDFNFKDNFNRQWVGKIVLKF